MEIGIRETRAPHRGVNQDAVDFSAGNRSIQAEGFRLLCVFSYPKGLGPRRNGQLDAQMVIALSPRPRLLVAAGIDP